MGLLVGDALGVPYEFHTPHEIPPADRIEFMPPSGFPAAHRGVPPGTWSDDGAQALCLLASLLEHGTLKLEDFARKIVLWYQEGLFTPYRKVFDCGFQTSYAIKSLLRGAQPESSGPNSEEDNGNGSLMRVLPLALWHTGSDEELVSFAHRQSAVTHGHARSMVCCAFYCRWARELLCGADEGWTEAARKLHGIYKDQTDLIGELTFVLGLEHREQARGSGYVLDTLWSARRVLRESSYEEVARAAVRLGNDTDTTACVAGGLAGVRNGVSGIPKRWLMAVRGETVYRPLLTALLKEFDRTGR